jgi:3-oxoacyl-[acyl-carrier protein] reductase
MKNVLIIGADGKLGSEIVEHFLLKNEKVIGTYHSNKPEKLDEKVRLFQLSLEDRKSIDKFLDEIKEIKIDLVINAAASKLVFNKFENIPIESFEEDLLINVVNYVYLLQKLVLNLNNGANIIMILTEMTFDMPPSYFSSYVTSKYALLGLMKSLANELKNRNIRVNAVSPGMMDTKFISKLPDLVKKKYLLDSKKFTEPKEVICAIEKIMESKVNGQNMLVK